MIFLNQAAVNSVPKEKAEDASGLFNAGRNLGGSIGLSIISQLQKDRNWLHTRRIEESLTRNSVAGQDYMMSLGQSFGHGDPQGGAMAANGMLMRQIQTQATVMSYADVFHVFAIFLIVASPLVLFLKPLPQAAKKKS